MDDAAWDGEEPGFELPPAPVPRHEREWRHPSEINRAQHTIVETRTVPRYAFVAAGVTGLALAVVLGRLMMPRAHDAARVDGDQPMASVSAPATAVRLASEPAITIRSATADRMVDVASGASGMIWDDGRHIVTTAVLGDPGTITEVTIGGSVVPAVVVAVDDGLTVLELDADAAMPPDSVALAAMMPVEGPVVVAAADGAAVAGMIGTDGGLVLDESAVSVDDGAPVINQGGTVVGLCGCLADHNIVIPLAAAEPIIERSELLGAWLGLRSDSGAVIDGVAVDSPAAEAGIEAGDVITAVNGKPVASIREIRALLRVLQPGAVVHITLQRAGSDRAISIESAARPKDAPPTSSVAPTPMSPSSTAPTVTTSLVVMPSSSTTPSSTTAAIHSTSFSAETGE